jgi:hypothetical protein
MAAPCDLSRVVTGPAEVRVEGEPVGRTSGPVRARFTPLLREETCAHTGETPVDYVVVGLKAELELVLAEYVLESLLLAMPHGAAAPGYVALGALPGARLSGSAAVVTVHPANLAEDDASEDVVLHNAVCTGVVELEYSNVEERLVRASFAGLADVSRAEGDLVARAHGPERG